MLRSFNVARPSAPELLEDCLTLMLENISVRAADRGETRVRIHRESLGFELQQAIDEINGRRAARRLSDLQVDFGFKSRILDAFERRAEEYALLAGVRRGR